METLKQICKNIFCFQLYDLQTCVFFFVFFASFFFSHKTTIARTLRVTKHIFIQNEWTCFGSIFENCFFVLKNKENKENEGEHV